MAITDETAASVQHLVQELLDFLLQLVCPAPQPHFCAVLAQSCSPSKLQLLAGPIHLHVLHVDLPLNEEVTLVKCIQREQQPLIAD